MTINTLEKLSELFAEFPGIGPRQSKRFVYFLLRKNPSYRKQLSEEIIKLGTNIRVCKESFQHFYSTTGEKLSPIARDSNRDRNILMIVEKDTDLETIERSKAYSGTYFVLGGTVPVMEKDAQKYIRIKELKDHVNKRAKEGIKEIIIALSLTPDGENTSEYIHSVLEGLPSSKEVTVTRLGRGISTGSELEYIDPDTMKSALENRY